MAAPSPRSSGEQPNSHCRSFLGAKRLGWPLGGGQVDLLGEFQDRALTAAFMDDERKLRRTPIAYGCPRRRFAARAIRPAAALAPCILL